MPAMIEVISRDQHARQSIPVTGGSITLPLDTPSVVIVHELADSIVSYARQGDDLLIQKDAGALRLTQFFKADAQGQASDLVLGSTPQTATHVTFSQAQAAAASADETVVLTPQLAALPDALAQTLAQAGGGSLGDGQVAALQAEAPVLLADEAASLTINAPLAGDDVISAAEYGQALEVSGTSTGLQTDDVVLVVLNGKTYSTAVEADGSWKVVVLAEDMVAVPAGVAGIVASATGTDGAVVQDSHSVFVITGGVQVSIDELAGDGLLNAAEAQTPLSVTGSVNNAAQGDEVVVRVLDREYTGVVDAQGRWSVDVPADIWQRLTDGDISVTATVTNAGGNSGSATRELTLDTQMPTLAINTLAEDDIVNAVEHGQALEVTGTTTGLQGGEIIRVELDGQTYTSTVSASGEWSVVVRAGDVSALSDGEHTLTAQVESHAGNSASGQHTMVVNTETPTVTINSPLAGDGVIDATELAQSLEVSGTSTGLDEGSIVNIAIGDHHFTTEVEADGSWFLGITRNQVSTFEDGLKVVSVSAENLVGNRAEATDFVVVNSEQGANFVVIDPITGDDRINAAEAASEQAITGTTKLAPAGAVVTVSVNGKSYTGTVAADGTWSVPVSADAWAELADGNVTVTADVTSAGSSGSATREVLLDTEAPTLSLNPLAGDDIINAAEQQQALGVSGTTTGLSGGEVVTVALNGKSYTTTVGTDGSWELFIGAKDVATLADGEHTVTASVSDRAGNPANVERDITVAASGLPTLTITTPLAGDDVINATEHDQFLPITGSSTGLAAGTLVTVELNGKTYAAGIAADGSWSMAVPAMDVSALTDGAAVVQASATDTAGNTVGASHQVMVDTIAPTLTIDPISGDGVIDAAEAAAGVPINGTAEPGAAVVIQVGGNEYPVTAGSDSTWTVMVPAEVWESLPEGDVTVTATATDSAGNSNEAQRNVLLNTTPSLTIDGFIDDAGAVQGEVTNSGALTDDATPTLFGTLSAPLKEGYSLVLYSRTTGDEVGQPSNLDPDSFHITDTSWTYTLPAEYALPNGVHDLEARIWNGFATDGNFIIASSNTFSIHVDSDADTLPTLSITGPVAGDDVINAAEHGQSLDISGTSTGIDAGDVVKITLNGKDYAAIVAADGRWTLSVTAADVGTLPEGNVVITASATDSVGNVAEASHQVVVDTHPPAKSANITGITDDTGVVGDFITSDTMPVISGGTSGAPYPQMRIEVSLDGGKTWQGGIKPDSNGYWQYAVEQELADGEYDVMARLVDPAGNASRADSITMTIDTAAPTVTVTIDSISEDTGQSATDFLTNDTSPTLHGSLSEALAAGETLQVSVDGGETWTAAAVDGTRWSYADGRVLSDGQHTYQTRLIDVAGNISAGASKTIAIDTGAPAKSANITGITDDTGVVGDFITSDTMPVISGGTSGAPYPQMRIEVSLDGGKTWQGGIKPDSNGYWQYAVEQELADGEYDVMARLVDPAGNASRADSITMTIDTATPTTTVTIDSISEDTGISATDFLTNDTSPTLHGSLSEVLAAGETLQVSVDDGETWSAATVDGTRWSYEDGRVLTNGNHAYQTRLIDAAGNISAGASKTITIDTSAPSKVAYITGISDDTGVDSDFVTSDTTPTIYGHTNGVPYPDMRVEVSLDGGKTWQGSVKPAGGGGNWQYAVEQELVDGEYEVMARLVDPAGNASRADTVTMVVDTAAPTIAINALAGDDIVNATEHGQALVVSGSTKGLDGGETVQVTLNGKTYTTAVASNGRWMLNVPASDVSVIADGDYSVTASVTDTAGNPASAERGLTVVAASDSAALSIASPLAGDDVINATEYEQPLAITGGSSGLAAGADVTVVLNGKSYTTTVAAGGHWSLEVPAADVATLPEGAAVINASATNAVGNVVEVSHQVTVDTTPPAAGIRFTAISDDSGVVGDFITNDTSLTFHLATTGNSLLPSNRIQLSLDGGKSWNDAKRDGTWDWSYTPAKTLADGQYDVMARTIDPAGNVGKMTSQVVTVDTTPPVRVATITGIKEDTDVAGDFITSDTTPVIYGGTGGAAPYPDIRVEVSLDGGKTWHTASTPRADGYWEYAVGQELADGQYDVMARLIDAAGNWSEPDQVAMTIDTTPAATLTIDVVAGDDIIDANEAVATVIVSGDSTGLSAGTNVAVTVGSESSQLPFVAEIQADGSWQISLSSNDIDRLGDGTYLVRAASSENGVIAERTVQANTTPSIVSDITIDYILDDVGPITGKVLNGGATDDNTVSVHGSLNAPLKDGQAVYFILGRDTVADKHDDVHGYVATVDGTSWSVDVPKALLNGVYSMGAWVQVPGDSIPLVIDGKTVDTWGRDSGGGLTDNFFITVDAGGPAITINTLAGDGIVSASEHDQPLAVSGTTTGLSGGETVTISLNGKSYTAVVATNGNWSVDVPAGDVSGLANGTQAVAASVRDAVGNVANTERAVLVDTTPPSASIRITAISDDTGTAGDFITSDTTLTIHGSLGNTLYAGNRVQVSVDGGKTWDFATVSSNKWSYVVDRALSEGQHEIQARTIETKTGNIGNMASQVVTIDASGPTAIATIDSITEDTGNFTDKGTYSDFRTSDTSPVLHGSLSKVLATGERLQVSRDGGKTWADATVDGTRWSYIEGQALAEGKYLYQTRVIDATGNTSDGASQEVVIDTSAWDGLTIDIRGISDDTGTAGDFITSDTSLTLHIATNNTLYQEAKVQVSTDGGVTWQDSDTEWDVYTADWYFTDNRVLSDGKYEYLARVVDPAGNSVATSQVVTIDANADGPKFKNPEDFEGYSSEQGLNFGLFTVSGSASVIPKGDGGIIYHNQSSALKVTDGGARLTLNNGWTANKISFRYGDSEDIVSANFYNAQGQYIYSETRTYQTPDGSTYTSITLPYGQEFSSVHFSVGSNDVFRLVYLDDIKVEGGSFGSDLQPRLNLLATHDDVMPGDDAGTAVSMLSGSIAASLATSHGEAPVDHLVSGSNANDTLESTAASDHFAIGNGGSDTLTYRLLDATDATGGNGADRISGFTVGKADTTSDADRIDLRELLADSGYQGSADGEVDAKALADYLQVTVNGSDTEIAIDRDGTGNAHEMTTLVTLSGVQTDLATLLANHQLVVN